jgi:hypothetical protein
MWTRLPSPDPEKAHNKTTKKFQLWTAVLKGRGKNEKKIYCNLLRQNNMQMWNFVHFVQCGPPETRGVKGWGGEKTRGWASCRASSQQDLKGNYTGLRIRIRNGSGFNRVSGSGSGSRRAKMSHKSRKISEVHVLKCWMASFVSWRLLL